MRWDCSHLVSHLERLVAESKSEHKNKVFLEICFCCIFSELLLNMQFGPSGSSSSPGWMCGFWVFCFVLVFFLSCGFSSCSVGRLNTYMDLVFGGRELKQGKYV